jgi:hypothetical protein
MSSIKSTPQLPPELWLMVFISLDNPAHALRTCRVVSRDFEKHVKTYFKAYFVPKRITMCVSSTEADQENPGWTSSIFQDGTFSHYSANGRTAQFALSALTTSEKRDSNIREGPKRLYMYSWSLDSYRKTTGSMLPTTQWPTVPQQMAVTLGRALGPEGIIRTQWRIDPDQEFVDFLWWELCVLLVRAPGYPWRWV